MTAEKITYREDILPSAGKIFKLYEDAGWEAYTRDLPRLMKAVGASLTVVTAWEGASLIGLARAVGDGETIVFLQDVLVLRRCRRHGVGSHLVSVICEKYASVRQKVLLTDDTPQTHAFYESLGFKPCASLGLAAYVKFD